MPISCGYARDMTNQLYGHRTYKDINKQLEGEHPGKRNQEHHVSRALSGMRPRATRAGNSGPTILAQRRNQRKSFMDVYHPGALHHATTIPMLTTIAFTSLSPSETASYQIQIITRPTGPHHLRGTNHLNGRKLTVWTRRGVN